MPRRLLEIALGAALAFFHCLNTQAADRPNVLLIAVDDLKPTIGAFGDPHAVTPAMDRLASQGMVFQKAYCQQAVCGASRASFFTGLRPDTTRVWDFDSKMRDHLPDLVTLPQHFKNHGYHTASVGKVFDYRCCDGYQTNDVASWSQPHTSSQTESLHLFDFADPSVLSFAEGYRKRSLELGEKEKPLHQYKPTVERLAQNVPDNTYPDGINTDWAIEFLKTRNAQAEPFFLAFGLRKPHLPFVAPKQYWDLYDRSTLPLADFQSMPRNSPPFHFQDSWELRSGYGGIPEGKLPESMQRELIHGYYACVSYIDAQISKILDTLEEQGLRENTIIVLWGDHGWHLGDHGMWCKHTNYEQATRVPFLIIPPSNDRQWQAASIETPVETLDLAPTLTELCGIANLPAFEGKSLVGIMKDPHSPHRPFAVSQYQRGYQGQAVMGYAFRNERYRFVAWIQMKFKDGERSGPLVATELYDLDTDPLETRNLALASEHSELAQTIQDQAAAFAQDALGVTWH